ncbi:zinc finger protein [Desulfitobacterium sp. PCE1]|uniref:zinc finger protein n=1 Tax=Desulfitobacterium sp. PCE1 TaxID=146907 RepID=UPI000373F934|nr:zinc finger protein [Desulfitobacterium sp. PCE1]
MCFRPPYAGKPVKCPSCGKMNPPKNTHCIQCKTELKADEEQAIPKEGNQQQ